MFYLLDMKFKIMQNGDWRKGDQGPHGKGMALNFRLLTPMKIYDQTIKMLNACNEYFRNRNKMRYRIGVYPEFEKPCFHLDIIQETTFWVCRYKRDKDGTIDMNVPEYKFIRDEVSFLNNLDCGL